MYIFVSHCNYIPCRKGDVLGWTRPTSPESIWGFYPQFDHRRRKTLWPDTLSPIPVHAGNPGGRIPPSAWPVLPHQPLCWIWWDTMGPPGSPPDPSKTGGQSTLRPLWPPSDLPITDPGDFLGSSQFRILARFPCTSFYPRIHRPYLHQVTPVTIVCGIFPPDVAPVWLPA